MELDLQKEIYSCFQPAAVLLETHEETGDTIVPDYSPDASRIVDTSACLLLRECEISGGKAVASGSVRLNVLYIADDGQGVRSLEATLPFEHTFEGTLAACTDAALTGRVCGCAARLLNPRKFSLRASVELTLTPYCHTTLTLADGIDGQETYGIEIQSRSREVSLICALREKEFSFSDELSLPNSCPPVQELLRQCVHVRPTECRAMGGKVILKGSACLELLYLTENGSLAAYSAELPFSQVLDGLEGDAVPSADALLRLAGYEVQPDEDGRGMSVRLALHAFLTLRCSETVRCITDLYSTSYDLTAQTERTVLCGAPACDTLRKSVREQIDTGVEASSVLCASVCFSGAGASSGAPQSLRTTAAVKVLYLDESGTPLCAERRIEISMDGETDPDAHVRLRELCADDVAASVSAGGVEVRFPAEFLVQTQDCAACQTLVTLHATPREGTAGDRPSLILRAVQEGETLWDIAKQYRARLSEIVNANALEEGETIAAGRMLLIPQK